MQTRTIGDDGADYRLTVKIRNNLLLEAMEKAGFKSGLLFAKAVGISAQSYYELVNMVEEPQYANGRWRYAALKLAEFLGVLPEEIFSDAHMRAVLKSKVDLKMDGSMANRLLAGIERAPLALEDQVAHRELADVMADVVSDLKDDEQRVIRARFGIGQEEETLDEVARSRGVTRERIRQIEAKALRKLRHPARSSKLRGFLTVDYIKEQEDREHAEYLARVEREEQFRNECAEKNERDLNRDERKPYSTFEGEPVPENCTIAIFEDGPVRGRRVVPKAATMLEVEGHFYRRNGPVGGITFFTFVKQAT